MGVGVDEWMDGGTEGMWMDAVGVGVVKAWWCGFRPARGWLRLFDHKPITHTQQATARKAIRTKSDSPLWGALHAALLLWSCLFTVFPVDCLGKHPNHNARLRPPKCICQSVRA